MWPSLSCRQSVAGLTIGLAALCACSGTADPPATPSGPQLADYYEAVAVDDVPLPAAVMLRNGRGEFLWGSLLRVAVTFDAAFTNWDMDATAAGLDYGYALARPDGPVVIGRDSVQVYLSPSDRPNLVGHFNETSLFLAPPGGTTQPRAPIDSIGAHAWRLRPATP